MEFDSLFTAIQGIMRSHQNKTIISFEKVNKDNDIISTKIVDSINILISELGLKDEHKRKINLLLIVNTNFPCITRLEDDKNFWHLLGVLPQMSPYLYFRVVTGLNFHSYIGEIVCSCPEYLSFEYIESLNDHLKLLSPEVIIPLLHSLYDNVFWKILLLQKEGKPYIIIKKFFTAFKDAMSFDFDELLKGIDWEREKKFIYFGYMTKMLLDTFTSAIKKFQTESPYNVHDVYEFNIEFDYSEWGECKNEMNWTNHCLGMLVAKTSGAVKSISVDIYMTWCEEDIKGSVEKTLQTSVREAAYNCREAMRTILHLSSEISGLKSLETSLNNIALQPITEDDEIKRADAETIVMNLLNPKKTQVKWLKGLICVPGIFQSSTYMQVILDNAHLFDLDVAKVLLDTLLDFLSNSQCPRDFYEVAKDSFFFCLKKQTIELQLDLLSYYFEKNCSTNMLEKENFEEVLITTLNKLSTGNDNGNEMVKEIVMLAFENSEKLIRSLLKECLVSSLKTDILNELLLQIPPLANIPCSNSHLGVMLGTTVHLMDTVVISLDKKKDNFIQLVKKLCTLGFLDENVFFPDHVMPRFEECIKENYVQQIIFYLDLLRVYVGFQSLPKNSAAFLVYCAKFLDNIRPGISSFSIERMTATTKAIELVQDLGQRIVKTKEDEDSEIYWLREMTRDLKDVTNLHLRLLWTRWGADPPSLPEWADIGLGLGEKLLDATPVQRRLIVTSAVKVLPTITIYEWYYMGSLDFVNQSFIIPTVEAIVDSILVCLQVPFLVKNLQIINSILINFSQFLWEKVIPKLKKCNQKDTEKLQERLTHLEEVLPVDLKKSRAPQIQLIIQAIHRLSH